MAISLLAIGTVRYFGQDSVHAYSLYHQDFNEKYLFIFHYSALYSALMIFLADVFEFTSWFASSQEMDEEEDLEQMLSEATLKSRLLQITWAIVQGINLFFTDSSTKIQPISRIRAKLLRFGKKSLSLKE